MKLAIIFLPIVFALTWALFIGLRINKVETRDGKRKFPKENNNLELIDNYLLDNNLQEPSNEILMAAELIDNYLGDKRFMRELEDRNEYDAA